MRSAVLLLILATAAALELETHVTHYPSVHYWDQSLDAKIIAGHNGVVSKDSGKNYTNLLTGDNVVASAVSSDGSRIAIIKDTTVHVFDSATNQEVATIAVPTYTDRGNSSSEELDVFLSHNGAHVAIYHKPGVKGFPISTTHFFSRTDNTYALSFIADKNMTRIAFSPNMTEFVAFGPKESDPLNMNLYWGNIDWTNNRIVNTGHSFRTADRHLDMDLSNTGLAYMQGNTGRPWIHDTKNDTKSLIFIGDYAGEVEHSNAAMTDDGKYLFTLSRDRHLLRRYLISEIIPMPFDSALLPGKMGTMMTTDAAGALIIAAINHNMSYINVVSGGVASVCATSSDCQDGLLCSPGHYCRKAAGVTASPGSPYVRVRGNNLTVRILRNDTSFITCEKAGTVSVGTYIRADNHHELGMFNNTFVDIAYLLADNKTTAWQGPYLMQRGSVQVPLGKIQSEKLLVRIKIDCYVDKFDGEVILPAISVKMAPTDPGRKTKATITVSASAGSVVGVMAVVMMIAAAMVL